MKQTWGALGLVALVFTFAACDRSVTAPNTDETAALNRAGTTSAGGSMKGAGGQMPAFYDGQLFTVNMMEISDDAAEHQESNPSLNEIYASNDLDEEQDFIPVIDAIQGDGFNPLWEQFLIVFNEGFTPHQFFSDVEVEDAAEGANPEITLVDTHEVYRCSVVGKKSSRE